jgi:hypothetical protein
VCSPLTLSVRLRTSPSSAFCSRHFWEDYGKNFSSPYHVLAFSDNVWLLRHSVTSCLLAGSLWSSAGGILCLHTHLSVCFFHRQILEDEIIFFTVASSIQYGAWHVVAMQSACLTNEWDKVQGDPNFYWWWIHCFCGSGKMKEYALFHFYECILIAQNNGFHCDIFIYAYNILDHICTPLCFYLLATPLISFLIPKTLPSL